MGSAALKWLRHRTRENQTASVCTCADYRPFAGAGAGRDSPHVHTEVFLVQDVRVCLWCSATKPASEFPFPRGKQCTACRNAVKLECGRKYHQTEKVDPRARTLMQARRRAWRERNPEKHRAHRLAHRALVRGSISKPDRCSRCEREHPRLHMHHADYDKPLSVIWFCPPCHREEHGVRQRAVSENVANALAVRAALLSLPVKTNRTSVRCIECGWRNKRAPLPGGNWGVCPKCGSDVKPGPRAIVRERAFRLA